MGDTLQQANQPAAAQATGGGASAPIAQQPVAHTHPQVARLRSLQRAAGNQALQRRPHTALAVSRPGDRFEREADAVAAWVMRQEGGAASRPAEASALVAVQRIATPRAMRQEEEPDDLDGLVQPQASGAGTPGTVPSSVIPPTSGQPLPPGTRGFMESRFQQDFSGVRVHTDGDSAQAARTLHAQAFTVGRDIYFGAGHYSPTTRAGQQLLAHELTHVVQQGGSAPSAQSVIQRQPAPDEREDAEAEPHIMRQEDDDLGATEDPTEEASSDEGDASTTAAGEQAEQEEAAEPEQAAEADEALEPEDEGELSGLIQEQALPGTIQRQADELEASAPPFMIAEQEPPAAPGMAVPAPAAELGATNQPGQQRLPPAVSQSILAVPQERVTPAESARAAAPGQALPTRTLAEQASTEAPGGSFTTLTLQAGRPAASAGAAEQAGPARQPTAEGAERQPEARADEARTAVAEPTMGAAPTSIGGQGRGAAGGQAAASALVGGVSFSREPSQLLGQLRRVSPVRAPFAFAGFAGAALAAIAARRRKHEASPPHARIQPRAPGASGGMARSAAMAEAPPRAELPPLQPQAPATERPIAHQHAGAPPAVRGVEEPTRQLDQAEQQGEPNFFDWVRNWLRRFIRAIPHSDTGVNTAPGAAPAVELTGAADPAQIAALHGHGVARLTTQDEAAERERAQDFGESEIAPEAEDEELHGSLPERKAQPQPACAPAERAQPLALDPEDEQELAERVDDELQDTYDAQAERMGTAEQQRDERLGAAEADAQQTIQEHHTAAYREQTGAIRSAQTDVQRQREQWREQTHAIQEQYDEEAGALGEQAGEQIQAFRAGEESAIGQRYRDTQQQAEAEQRRVEGQAEQVRREAEQESGSWFSRGLRWVKNKVKDAFHWITQRIKQLFDDLRAWVKQKFEDLKAWAVEKIEQARRWVIGRLERFRKQLNGLVDRYLGRFPRIARFFKHGINGTIAIARRAVNLSAAVLKRGVSIAIGIWAKSVDIALVLAETVTLSGLELACGLVVSGFNLAILLVDRDLAAAIEFIRDLPESALMGPLWPIVKAGLIGFLKRLRSKPPDEKKRFIRKVLGLAISPSFIGGYLLGILKGFVLDGLLGIILMLWDVITGIPEMVRGIYEFFRSLLSDTEAIEQIIAIAGEVAEQLRAFLGRPDAAEQIVGFLKRSPIILFDFVRRALQAGKDVAREAGTGAADALFKYVLETSNYDLGMKVGRVVGQIIFEVLAAVFTAGVSAAIKAGAKVFQVVLKGLRWLIEGLVKGARLILGALRRLMGLVRGALRLAQRLSRGLSHVVGRLRELVDRVVQWFMRAFRRLRDRFGRRRSKRLEDPAEQARKQRLVAAAIEDARHMAGSGKSVWWLRGKLFARWRWRGIKVSIVPSPDGMWLVIARGSGKKTTKLHKVSVFSVGSYSFLRGKVKGTQAHHIIQNAWATYNKLAKFRYSRYTAPAIALEEGAAATPTKDATGHRATFTYQNIANRVKGYHTTLNEEWSTVSAPALKAAGVPRGARLKAKAAVDLYFVGVLRLTRNTSPPRRKK